MTAPPWTIDEINALDRDAFVARFGMLFEASAWVAEEGHAAQPFADRDRLHDALVAVVARASDDRKVALIRAHPDLAGRAALAGTLGPASQSEQAAAGLDPDRLSPDDIASFRQLNDAYRLRFGFPFVICARENRKERILAGIAERLANGHDQEIALALAEIAKIARHRLSDLVRDGSERRRGGVMDGIRYDIGYGKLRVPVYRTQATPLRGVPPIPESAFTGRDNALLAMEVDVEVLGNDFLPAYTDGDNAMVVATDSMKNFVLRQALTYPGPTMDGFLLWLGRGFTETYPQLRHLRLTARELPFAAVPVPTEDGFAASDALLAHTRAEAATTTLEVVGAGNDAKVVAHRCGLVGLRLMKLTGSAFTAFVRDGYTTLPDRRDRPLYIFLDLHWRYAETDDLLGGDAARYVPPEQVRDLIASVFDRFVSESIQHLVHEMGSRLLERFPQLDEVGFAAQNRTRDPVAESETDPRVKVYTDPFPAYGEITLTMTRAASPSPSKNT